MAAFRGSSAVISANHGSLLEEKSWVKRVQNVRYLTTLSLTIARNSRPETLANSLPYRPKPENPFRSRGDEHFRQGKYEGAVFMYEEAANQEANDVLLLLQLAMARTMCSSPQLQEALKDVARAIQLDTTNGPAWRLKGNIHMRLGDTDAAEAALMQATSLLNGWEQLQAQQSLAEIRMKRATASPTTRDPSVVSSPVRPPQSPAAHHNEPVANTQTVQHIQAMDSLPADNRPARTPNIVVSTSSSAPNTQPSSHFTPTTPASHPRLSSPTPNLPVRTASSPIQGQQNLSLPSATPTNIAASQAPVAVNNQPVRSVTPGVYAQGEILAQQLDIPTEAPPSYNALPDVLWSAPAAGMTDPDSIAVFQTAFTAKNQGSLYMRPWTMTGQIDSVQLLFRGRSYLESVALDLPPIPTTHTSWKKYQVSTVSHPGTNFIDYDCESAIGYEGNHLSSVTVLGYAEEYREHQLALSPLLQLTLEAAKVPPSSDVGKIVQRIQLLRNNPMLEDNAGVDEILSLPPVFSLVTTKQMVEDICMVYNRGSTDEPTRFLDFLKVESFSAHMFGTGVGLKNFLFLILIGAELAIRLNKLGAAQKYSNVMRTSTSALVVTAIQWMENVTIHTQPNNSYVLSAHCHVSQCDGLLQFAEAIGWPYMEEATREIRGLWAKLVENPANVHNYLKDWLYGLVLPGKFFRQRIMSCLVLACPSTKHLGFAPYYDSGLVIGNKSYWPKRTVLGRVLGGLRNPKSTCGWIGPVPAPVGFTSNWVLLHARHIDFVTPVVDDLTKTSVEILGFSEADMIQDPRGVEREITNMDNWKPPTELPARPGPSFSTAGPTSNETSPVRLSAIRLSETAVLNSNALFHHSSLEFVVHGSTITFSLHNNPVFVHAPRCVGTEHPIHKRQVEELLQNMILAKHLRPETVCPTDKLTIIDTTENGEEAMARAWCAGKGRHAIIRKGGIGCFTCATNLAAKRTGLGFNVLIWCN